ncbi:hypothetical protein J4405_03695 [Candidatus Woesearchaeota archaeon]|nr:hypothetical protein [Candidatus Woesearchaeota archaeon]
MRQNNATKLKERLEDLGRIYDKAENSYYYYLTRTSIEAVLVVTNSLVTIAYAHEKPLFSLFNGLTALLFTYLGVDDAYKTVRFYEQKNNVAQEWHQVNDELTALNRGN